jgi:predicted Zn finger-like uncharacterized protein
MSVGSAPLSMITSCPNCATAFRVTQMQLQAQARRVRCGRCGTVFHAQAIQIPDPAAEAAGDAEAARESGTPAVTQPARRPASKEAVASMLEGEGIADSAPPDFGPPPRTRPSRLWLLAIALALMALAAQGAYRYRGELALTLPQAKPLIQQICIELGCEVPLPRRAELLGIETSDLQADSSNPKVLVFSATLRNRAAFVQALPALELALTDAQDQAVARRVLMPQQYLPRGTRPDAGFAAGSELQVRVYIEVSGLKAAGYRIYLFYP